MSQNVAKINETYHSENKLRREQILKIGGYYNEL